MATRSGQWGYRNTVASYTAPTGPDVSGMYQSVLSRWLEQQRESQNIFKTAEKPLTETVGLFRPGGGYGKGQYALIEDEARRERAKAMSDLVSTGMSSGSLASAVGMRSAADITKSKLGVEDVRTKFLADALNQLAGLRGAYSSQVSSAQAPDIGAVINAMASIFNTQQQGEGSFWDAVSRRGTNVTPTRPVITPEEESPWASLQF